MSASGLVAMGILAALLAAVFITGRLRKRPLIVVARMTTQAFFALLFLFLLTQTVAPIEGYLALSGVIPADFFMRLSPLSAAAAMIAGRVVIAGMLLSIVTLVTAVFAGRWFCGWVCPLGTTFDVADWLFLRKLERPNSRDSILRSAKFLLLAGILVAALFGGQVAGWFDPMSIVTRSYAVAVLPAADRAVKGTIETPLYWDALRENAPALADSMRHTSQTLKGLHVLYERDRYYAQFGVFAALLAALIGLQAYQKRFWCRKLCPLGAMLGLAGKWRPLGVRLDAKTCIDCGKCRNACPVGAIEGKSLSPEECTFCGSCVPVCPVGALSVGIGRQPAEKSQPPVVPGRRAFLAAAAAGAAAAPALLVNTQRRPGVRSVIRPPGAQDEDRFLDTCIRCGECMKACPQNALHPTGFEAGLAGLWTPKIVPVIGYCDYNCLSEDSPVGNFCSTVCPTGAIRKLKPDEHRSVRRGTAYFRTDRCIPYVEKVECGVCVEHCPVPQKALKNEFVQVVDVKTGQKKMIQRPYVDKTLCIGCGQCEYVCPLKGPKGIRVEPLRSLV